MATVDRFLRIAELYGSLQGEGRHTGLPCFFIRTAGCDLRCVWCDTPEALEATSGRWMTREEVFAAIPQKTRLVQITGGEPLLQKKSTIELMEGLIAAGTKVLLETGGHRSLEGVPESVHVVMDIKLPGSHEQTHDFERNFRFLKESDEIKFVVASDEDFQFALQWVRRFDLERFELLFSPVWGAISPLTLARLVLESGVWGRLQLQQHKLVWGPSASGV